MIFYELCKSDIAGYDNLWGTQIIFEGCAVQGLEPL